MIPETQRAKQIERAAGMSRTEADRIVSKIRTQAKWEWLSVAEMKVDARAQRILRPAWCKRRVGLFNPDQLGAICISRREDGTLWIMDGQHRVELVRMVGWGDQKMFCEIFENLTIKEEAALFLARNDKISPRTFDKFVVGITAQEDVPVAIQRIVSSLGLKLAEGNTDASISAVSSLRWIYEGGSNSSSKEGALALGHTLRAILDAWGPAGGNFQGDVISGLGLVHLRYGKKLDHSSLVDTLIRVNGGAIGLLHAAKAIREGYGGRLAMSVGAAIVLRYNRKKRTGKLESWWS
jgi:hypothetical protein